MKIETSGFYIIDSSDTNIVVIPDNVKVCIFDTSSEIQTFEIGNNSKFHYFSYFSNGENISKHFKIVGEKSDVVVKSFHYSLADTIKLSFLGELQNSYSKLDMNLVSIVGEGGSIDIDGIVQINENIACVEGYLKQQNIFLGNTGKIRGIPTLLVRSNDVKASHGCNIEKMSDEKLFYLRSRGISKQSAIQMMVESYVRNVFGYLEEVDAEFYINLVERITQKIQ